MMMMMMMMCLSRISPKARLISPIGFCSTTNSSSSSDRTDWGQGGALILFGILKVQITKKIWLINVDTKAQLTP